MSQREILFKAKRADNGNWIQGNLIVNETTGQHMIMHVWPEHPDLYDFRTVIPETVCQYTGLTDKNGKKIFENDIMRYSYISTRGKDRTKEYVVQWVDNGFHIFDDDYGFSPQSLEVIGNIHDN